MSYNKTVWEDRESEFPNRYKDQNDNVLQLTRDEGVVTNTGTFINAAVMNNIENAVEELSVGWQSATGTFTYTSADAPTFVMATSVNTTSFISVGMKLKLTQGTTKYFIVTAQTSNSLTLYGGTDYTLTSAAITEVQYSPHKAPFGFPLNPDKWTVTLIDTDRRQQEDPSADVWYNPDGISITVPIGLWNISYKANTYARLPDGEAGFRTCSMTLSETNDGDTLTQFKTAGYTFQPSGSNSLQVGTSNILSLLSKTTLYLNVSTSRPYLSRLGIDGGWSATVIKATTVYL